MDGFKNSTKMKFFKEGGSVKYESRKQDKEEMSADIAQDKKIVKKAIAIHDNQEHPGEKTDLSKLKKGGRAKKELGTARKFIKTADAPSGAKKEPNKYKTGGTVTNVYEAKKSAGDKDNIKKVKDITPVKLCGGKSVKKYADGGGIMGAIGNVGTQLKNNVMGTPEQNRIAQARMDMIAKKKAMAAAAMQGAGPAGLGQAAQQASVAQSMSAPAPAPAAPGINAGAGAPAAGAQNPPVPGGMKKGGKAKGKC
jgi:hypothetical protein